jgi:hypothetical protein
VLGWLGEVDRAGAAYANPKVEVTYADEYVGGEQTWADSDKCGGGARVDELEGGTTAAAAFECPSPEQQRDRGLEIISREEWEDRLGREGNRK